jgi:hypothetical protein
MAASCSITAGNLATPSGVRGGNSSKEKLSGEVMRNNLMEVEEMLDRSITLVFFLLYWRKQKESWLQ